MDKLKSLGDDEILLKVAKKYGKFSQMIEPENLKKIKKPAPSFTVLEKQIMFVMVVVAVSLTHILFVLKK